MRGFLLLLMVAGLTTASNGQTPRMVIPVGHTANVMCISTSPNQKFFITGSYDGTARIWDIITGREVQVFKGHTKEVDNAIFSPDGKRVLTTALDHKAKLWDVYTGKEIFTLPANHALEYVSFTHDGKKILLASPHDKASIFDALTGKLIRELEASKEDIIGAAFSPKGNYIVATSGDDFEDTDRRGEEKVTTSLWNVATGEMWYDWLSERNPVFSKDEKYIATNAADKRIIIREVKTGNQVKSFQTPVTTACDSFSTDGKLLVCSSGRQYFTYDIAKGGLVKNDKTIEFPGSSFNELTPDGKNIVAINTDGKSLSYLDAITGKTIRELSHSGEKVMNHCFTKDSKYFIATLTDLSIGVWELSSGKKIHSISSPAIVSVQTELSHDGTSTICVYKNDFTPRVWKNKEVKTSFLLKGHTSNINSIAFSPDDRYIATVAGDSTARIWDAKNGRQLFLFRHPDKGIWNCAFTSDGKSLLTYGYSKKVRSWDIESGTYTESLKIDDTLSVDAIDFSADGKYAVTLFDYIGDLAAGVWNLQTGKLLKVFRDNEIEHKLPKFTPDGKYLICVGNYKPFFIWDIEKGTARDFNERIRGYTPTLEFSSSGKYMASLGHIKTMDIWDVANGKRIFEIEKPSNVIFGHVNFSADEKYVIANYAGDSCGIWETQTGNQVASLDGHTAPITFVRFVNDGKNIVTTSNDYTTKYWEAKRGKLIYTRVQMKNDEDFFAFLPSGYYFCSANAAKKLHYVTKDLKIITFEQLDARYNRPDKVLEAIGNGDTALIRSYRRAYEKRMRKLGIDTANFHEDYAVPQADFAGRDAIAYERKNPLLKLHITGKDQAYPLNRFNIWINETPLFGQKGINISNRNSQSIDTTITITLSEGENQIETSVNTPNGVESYRVPLYVKYNASTPAKSVLRFIGIGIDQFSDEQYNLRYSAKDIRDLSLKLKGKYGESIIIDTLFNKNVTVQNVRALKKKLTQASENDKVIVAYSGHGVLSKDLDYFLSTYKMNFEAPQKDGLAYEDLEDLLDRIPARRKLLLIDACHSGEVDKEELVLLNNTPDSLIKGLKPVAYRQEGKIGLQNSFELMQDLFVNVGKSTGTTILSAASGTQFALERNDLKNGVFTYAILDAMKRWSTITVSALKKIVSEKVIELTNGLQQPTFRNEMITTDWSVW